MSAVVGGAPTTPRAASPPSEMPPDPFIAEAKQSLAKLLDDTGPLPPKALTPRTVVQAGRTWVHFSCYERTVVVGKMFLVAVSVALHAYVVFHAAPLVFAVPYFAFIAVTTSSVAMTLNMHKYTSSNREDCKQYLLIKGIFLAVTINFTSLQKI